MDRKELINKLNETLKKEVIAITHLIKKTMNDLFDELNTKITVRPFNAAKHKYLLVSQTLEKLSPYKTIIEEAGENYDTLNEHLREIEKMIEIISEILFFNACQFEKLNA